MKESFPAAAMLDRIETVLLALFALTPLASLPLLALYLFSAFH